VKPHIASHIESCSHYALHDLNVDQHLLLNLSQCMYAVSTTGRQCSMTLPLLAELCGQAWLWP
jgi:hypothetical protein